MAHEAASVATSLFELDVVEACLEVYKGNIGVTAKEASIAAGFVQLVLVLLCPLVHRDDILDHAVGLTRLAFWD